MEHNKPSRWTASQWNYFEAGRLDYMAGFGMRKIDNEIHGTPYRMGYAKGNLDKIYEECQNEPHAGWFHKE